MWDVSNNGKERGTGISEHELVLLVGATCGDQRFELQVYTGLSNAQSLDGDARALRVDDLTVHAKV